MRARPSKTSNAAPLKKERGVWVYQGGKSAKRLTESLQKEIDALRKQRAREVNNNQRPVKT